METNYQISLHIKTPAGFETYGNFDLGADREQAVTIVEQFKGTENISEKSILYMDLTEIQNGIPLPQKILHCTLDDIVYNIRIITRDVFKNLSLWWIGIQTEIFSVQNWNFCSFAKLVFML